MDHMNVTVGRVLKLNPIEAAAQYARTFYDLLSNRRKYSRTLISGTVQITRPGYTITAPTVCSCVDISPRGMAIDSHEPFPPDTIILLNPEGDAISRAARVCYCRQFDMLYRIGLEFTTGDP